LPTPTPSPALRPPATPAPTEPSFDPLEAFVIVQIGPVASPERAAEIAAHLTLSGYAARVTRVEGTRYLITLGPYRRSTAEAIAGLVRGRFGSLLRITLQPAP
jgi:cell division septation protein DedD